MIVRTFTGPSLRDALKSVRDTFGADAVILDTKFGDAAGGRLGTEGKTVSVTAACEPESAAQFDVPVIPTTVEGPKTLHLKGEFPEDSPGDPAEHYEANTLDEIAVETSDPKAFAPIRPSIPFSPYAQLLSVYHESLPESGVWHSLCQWLATQPQLISGIADSFATHLAESIPPLEAFLNVRLKGQNVLFVGERGVGKSTLMFKSFAARWKCSERRPGLRVISELEGHGQEHLESLCQGCDVEFSAHEFKRGRLEFDRPGKGDLLAEFVPGRAYSNLTRQAKIIRRALKPDVVALVLNATGNPQTWSAACRRFAAFGLTHIVFTHWDECQPWWDAVSLARREAILLSYRTYGIEPFGEIDPFTTTDLRSGLIEHITRAIGAETRMEVSGPEVK